MKNLPLNLAKHPLLIQAFSDVKKQFTTEKVWADDPYGNIKLIDAKDQEAFPYVALAPAPDLDELLDLAWKLIEDSSWGDIIRGNAKELSETCMAIVNYGDRLTRLAEAIIAVLGERQ